MLKGSCACGEVAYEIRGEFIGPICHCHCWQCRKHSGTSFGTTVGIQADDLFFVAGKSRLSSWESSPGVHRFFASCCGSPIFKHYDKMPKLYGFRLGTLDSDPGLRVEKHIWVGSKVPWVELMDGLPHETQGCPFGTLEGRPAALSRPSPPSF